MDSIKGAIQLRKLLAERDAAEADPPAEQAEVPAAAPPLFHWLGVAPAADDPE